MCCFVVKNTYYSMKTSGENYNALGNLKEAADLLSMDRDSR
jgi:hypothetical protein